jgi:transcriptional regulator with XRE-family HTH domain
MSQTTPFLQLREQAIALRRAGRSRREIKELLGIGSNQTLSDALRGEPPQPWTWRPNAKDGLRTRARQLREQGHSYDQIVAELGVSKSTVSAWVSDMPRPDRLSYEECCKRQAAAVARYWATERPRRDAERAAVRATAAAEIGTLSDRETIIAGAVAYWCEGGKSKPHRRADRVSFINSDPALIRFFLRFLHVAGIATDQMIFRVYVHESADAGTAERFWREVTHAHADRFRRPTLKRHNPRTVRKNVGADYHGCLRVDVRRSSGLYRKIEGWAAAAMAGVDGAAGEVGTAATPVEQTAPLT